MSEPTFTMYFPRFDTYQKRADFLRVRGFNYLAFSIPDEQGWTWAFNIYL